MKTNYNSPWDNEWDELLEGVEVEDRSVLVLKALFRWSLVPVYVPMNLIVVAVAAVVALFELVVAILSWGWSDKPFSYWLKGSMNFPRYLLSTFTVVPWKRD